MNKMDKELKEKWLKALRSGRYRQGEGSLREKLSNGKLLYCCLGVLGNCISRNKWVEGKPTNFGHNVLSSFGPLERVDIEPDSNGDTTAFLPLEILPSDVQVVLSRMNDQGDSFEDIANYIEENL